MGFRSIGNFDTALDTVSGGSATTNSTALKSFAAGIAEFFVVVTDVTAGSVDFTLQASHDGVNFADVGSDVNVTASGTFVIAKSRDNGDPLGREVRLKSAVNTGPASFTVFGAVREGI